MNLSSVNITRTGKLSVRAVKVQAVATEPKSLPTPIEEPSIEERIYTNIAQALPGFEEFTDRLGLVSERTGGRIDKTNHSEEIDSEAFVELANSLLKPMTSYSEEEVKRLLTERTRATGNRLEKAFYYLLRADAIRQTPGGKLYLSDSTPF